MFVFAMVTYKWEVLSDKTSGEDRKNDCNQKMFVFALDFS